MHFVSLREPISIQTHTFQTCVFPHTSIHQRIYLCSSGLFSGGGGVVVRGRLSGPWRKQLQSVLSVCKHFISVQLKKNSTQAPPGKRVPSEGSKYPGWFCCLLSPRDFSLSLSFLFFACWLKMLEFRISTWCCGVSSGSSCQQTEPGQGSRLAALRLPPRRLPPDLTMTAPRCEVHRELLGALHGTFGSK